MYKLYASQVAEKSLLKVLSANLLFEKNTVEWFADFADKFKQISPGSSYYKKILKGVKKK